MKSLGARLTLWYAASATLSFALLSLIGGALLQSRIVAGLDELNAAEFEQLKDHIGHDYPLLGPQKMADRLAHVSEYQSVLFYISIDRPFSEDAIFQSHNMDGHQIPDVRGRKPYSAEAPGLGPLRVQEFALPPYDVTIATSARSVRAVLRAYAITSLALASIMIIGSVLIGFAMRNIVLRPIRQIQQTAERIRSDNLGERIPVGAAKDELSELASLLNGTFDRLESAFVQMRRFAEETSHELKTPLSLIQLHAEQILKSGHEEQAEAALVQIDEIARLNRFIDQMLFLSQAEANTIEFDLSLQDPWPFLEAFDHDAKVLAESVGLTFALVYRPGGLIAADTTWLRQVLFNLLTNAIRVSPQGGRITLTASFTTDEFALALEDEGPGLSRRQCDQIFERFTRLRDRSSDARGAGLGLTISRTIIRLHSGLLWAEPVAAGRGLALQIRLPKIGEQHSPLAL